MKSFFLFFKKTLKTPAVIGCTLLLFVICTLSFGYDEVRENLPCAICTEDDSAEAQAVLDYLTSYDFVIYETRQEVQDAVISGEADCAAVLVSDFSVKLESGDMEGACELLVSSRTTQESTYSLLICTGIIEVYTPYLTEQAIENEGYEVADDQLDAFLEKAQAEMTILTFEIEDTEGTDLSESASANFPIGMMAVIFFAAYGLLAVVCARRYAAPVRPYFPGYRQYVCSALLPRVFSVGLVLALAAEAAALCGRLFLSFDLTALLVSTAVYYLILSVFFLLLLLLPLRDHVIVLIIIIYTMLSLVLCPLYVNLALYIPQLKIVRVFALPYWLYALEALF